MGLMSMVAVFKLRLLQFKPALCEDGWWQMLGDINRVISERLPDCWTDFGVN